MDEREQWLEAAMAQYEEPLLRLCFVYPGDMALAEDAVQEVFLKAWRNFSRFRGEASDKTWLMHIAVNTCRDVRRGAWFRHRGSSVPLDALPETAVPFSPRDDTVTRAVMALKPRYRQAALLHWYMGLTGEETAEALHLSRSAAFARLKQARSILKNELREWYDEA